MARALQNLIVTRDGRALENQSLGVRLFRDAASARERYRLVFDRSRGWVVYYCGRPIVDPPAAYEVGAVIDYLRAMRGGSALGR